MSIPSFLNTRPTYKHILNDHGYTFIDWVFLAILPYPVVLSYIIHLYNSELSIHRLLYQGEDNYHKATTTYQYFINSMSAVEGRKYCDVENHRIFALHDKIQTTDDHHTKCNHSIVQKVRLKKPSDTLGQVNPKNV